MVSNKSNVYVNKKTKDGQDVLCPIDELKTDGVIENEPEECVEKDVVGRYAGNIRVRSQADNEDEK